jgi:hypothetical protein
MELAHFDEHGYELELQAYQIAFHDFKYKPPNFIYVEIRTSSREPTTPFMVQLVVTTKLISPLKGGSCLEIIPLLVQTFTMPIHIAAIIIKLVRNSEKSIKEQAEPIDPSFTILDSGVGLLEFLYVSLFMTPHQTCIR